MPHRGSPAQPANFPPWIYGPQSPDETYDFVRGAMAQIVHRNDRIT